MTHNLIKLFRVSRYAALFALSPIDYIFRALNNKTDLPPLHLRRYVGPLRSFESSGAEFMTYLTKTAKLRPDERVLDIGCGCGQMALHLKEYLDKKGSYLGVDIHQPSIRWCQKNVASQRINFRFARIDVRNRVYNARGAHPAETYRFPYEEGSFDLILLKSVFTHMRPLEVGNYLGEVSRLMSAEGRCLATFFLLNQEQARLVTAGLNTLSFNYGETEWRYRYEDSPESAIAYNENFVMQLLDKHGLALKEVIYGNWAGRKQGLSFQDILLIKKN